MVIGLNRIFNILPMNFVLAKGRFWGNIIYFLSGKRSRITYSNLKAAYCGEKKPEELAVLARKVYISTGETFAELLALTKVDKKYVEKYVTVHNLERVEKAAKNPNGMIFVSAHFGNWELCTATSAIKGFPMYSLARDQKMARLNELLNKLRESKGNLVVRKGMDIKNVFRILKSGKSIGLLADQNAGSSGVLIDFFGRPASTAIGPYRFAQKTGAVILTAFIHRRKGPYQDLFVEEMMEIKDGEDLAPYAKKYNDLLEKHIRRSPEQWFWMHKRWKKTTLKKIMILDDGKKGHLKQSLSVLKQISVYRKDEGFSDKDLEVAVVGIKFKTKWHKTILNVLCPFLTWRLGIHLKMLKWALTKDTFENAINRYADVIVSSGSNLYGVNHALKIENYARNVAVLDPGPMMRGKFNVLILPEHDARKVGTKENVSVTKLAPNLIDLSELLTLKAELSDKNADGTRGVGVLIGGENDHYYFVAEKLGNMIREIVGFCEERKWKVYATTSRRTPGDSEIEAEEIISKSTSCGFFVKGKNDDEVNTVEKILALSDVVVVSGESISMVSEAVSSGRMVLAFMPEAKKTGANKYGSFIKNLENEGYLRVVTPANIRKCLENVFNEELRGKVTGDNKKIYEKLYKLF